MPPLNSKPSQEKMKQKSLMGWFAKDGQSSQAKAGTPSGTQNSQKFKPLVSGGTKTALKPPKTIQPSSSSSVPPSSSPSDPLSRIAQSKGHKNGHARSDSTSSAMSALTPPTSDAIDVDVDMVDDEEEFGGKAKGQSGDESGARVAASRGKRKSIVDSDEERDDVDTVSFKKGLSAYRPSPEPAGREKDQAAESRSKKARLSEPVEDDEEEEDAIVSIHSRLSRFKRHDVGPKRQTPANSNGADMDALLDSDAVSEASVRSKARSRRSASSSARSVDDDFINDDDDEDGNEDNYASDASDEPQTKKTKKTGSKPKTSGKPPLKPAQSSGVSSSVGEHAFLTAAERRALEKKNEKKAGEDPYAFLQDPRDKDGKKPDEPGYDPRTLFVPKSAWASFTPFEKQFWEIKQNHFDTVLFFQKGKFLELYEDDARIGHQQFDLKLTERVKMSMVGVPESSFNFWAAKFLAKGHKVGRVDQAETALGAEMRVAANKANKSDKKFGAPKQNEKIVRRELNKVYTNGTLVDPELLTDDQAGHCVAIREVDAELHTYGVCVLDCSTSEFNLCEFMDDVCNTKLETMMRQLRPKEILFTKGSLSVSTTRLLKVVLPDSCLWTALRESEGFHFDQTLAELKTLFPDEEDSMEEDSGIPDTIREMLTCRSAVEALGLMIWYLRQLNIDKDILSMKNFNIYDPMKSGQGLVLDGQSLAHIEILVNNEGSDEGSLLKILNRCVTPFGKRLFRIWLCMPLQQISDINARLDAVEDLMNHPTFESDFLQVAKGLPDLERIVSRVHARNCKVKDFLKLLKSFAKLSHGFMRFADTATSFNSSNVAGLLRSAPDLTPHIKNIESMYSTSETDNDELTPVEGKDEAYDEIMQEIRETESLLDSELKKLEKKAKCDLTYWHSHLGNKDIYLVQTKAGQKNLPNNWVKNGGTKTVNRWVVPELTVPIRQLKEARENRNTAIKTFKFRVYAEFDKDRDIWLRAVKTMAELDCLFSLAKSSQALGEPCCRPEFIESDSAFVDFEELRHPALCLKADDFIPNDVKLGGDVGRIALLTGPNMGGKSTVMRMTAVGVIMAQLGMLVPAKSARLSPVDSILTRMGAYDNMFSNASTFKVELDECCKILRDATPRSLVILDELGRGTSTFDGMAIAGAVLHQLATHTLPLAFFATHYGSLTDDYAYHPNIRNMHMATLVDDEKRELVFLYKLVQGVATGSFGTHVANLAGVPMDVIIRAESISADFAQKFKERIEGRRSTVLPVVAQADFAYLLALATGKIQQPENRALRREVLAGLKKAVVACIKKKQT